MTYIQIAQVGAAIVVLIAAPALDLEGKPRRIIMIYAASSANLFVS